MARLLAALLWAGMVSCGAGSSLPAAPDRPARAIAVTPAPVPAADADLPAASDALLEHTVSESASTRATEQRFPLYGVAFQVYTQVFSEPSARGVAIGHLRRGTTFRASAGRDGNGCAQPWHELAVGGFVCAGNGVMVGREPQSFSPAPLPAVLSDALPYRYAKNISHTALQYWRIPTKPEQAAAAKVVTDFAEAAKETAPPKPVAPPIAPPPASATPVAEEPVGPTLPDYARMVMEPGFYVSLDDQPQGPAPQGEAKDGDQPAVAPEAAVLPPPTVEPPSDDRSFVRTVRGAYVEATGLTDVKLLIGAPGVVLGPGQDLPVGIVYRGSAKTFRRDALSGELRPGNPLPKFSAVALTGAAVWNGNLQLHASRSGLLVSDGNLRIAQRGLRPAIVPRGARLIHVNLAQQTLVAYDGERPVFATLVSTGKEGYDTPAGVYRIQHKNVTATMDGLAGSEDAYSIEDVPWTMYFHGSYALHGAFWHDRFGQTRSHGCINLAPADARWLFRWVTPTLPSGYHGIVATRADQGTFVWIEAPPAPVPAPQ